MIETLTVVTASSQQLLVSFSPLFLVFTCFVSGNFVSLEIANLKLDARRNCYPNKDYLIIENVDGTPISAPICTLIRRNPIRAMAQNALCVKLGLSFSSNLTPSVIVYLLSKKYLQLALTWQYV